MAMVTAMVMAMGVERIARRQRERCHRPGIAASPIRASCRRTPARRAGAQRSRLRRRRSAVPARRRAGARRQLADSRASASRSRKPTPATSTTRPRGPPESDFVDVAHGGAADQRRRAPASSSTVRSPPRNCSTPSRRREQQFRADGQSDRERSRRSRSSSSSTPRRTSRQTFFIAVRRAAGQPRQRDRRTATRRRPTRQPLHPGRARRIEHLLSVARRQYLDDRQPVRQLVDRRAEHLFNQLHGSLNSPAAPWGWTLEYNRHRATRQRTSDIVRHRTRSRSRAASCPTRSTRSCSLACADGYENDQFPLTSSEGVDLRRRRAVDIRRTGRMVDGFWEHRFFGASYSAQISHRLPDRAQREFLARHQHLSAECACRFRRAPTCAASSTPHSRRAFRIPRERAQAVEQFLAQTGLPPTLATPVNIFARERSCCRQSATVSLVLIGVRNSLGFTLFYLKSEAISGTGAVLPPALQFGQNNTQTGGGVSFSHRLSGHDQSHGERDATRRRRPIRPTARSPTRDRTTPTLSLSLSTQFGPKTTGVGRRQLLRGSIPAATSTRRRSTSSVNVYAGINHTF